jgi:hypothetical protein
MARAPDLFSLASGVTRGGNHESKMYCDLFARSPAVDFD